MTSLFSSVSASTWVSLLGVFVAIGAFSWTIRWSYEQKRRDALIRIAEYRFSWIKEFRSNVAEYLALTMAARKRFIDNVGSGEEFYEEDFALKNWDLYNRIHLMLPAGNHHFDEFRKAFTKMHDELSDQNSDMRTDVFAELGTLATVVAEVERKLAERELRGIAA